MSKKTADTNGNREVYHWYKTNDSGWEAGREFRPKNQEFRATQQGKPTEEVVEIVRRNFSPDCVDVFHYHN